MNTPAGVECIHWPNFGEPFVGSIVEADRMGVWKTMKPCGAKQYTLPAVVASLTYTRAPNTRVATEHGFPKPLAEDVRGRVWRRSEIQAWAKRWRRKKPWR
jgi:predicted DNA-binding transcriptional regulator AlpA